MYTGGGDSQGECGWKCFLNEFVAISGLCKRERERAGNCVYACVNICVCLCARMSFLCKSNLVSVHHLRTALHTNNLLCTCWDHVSCWAHNAQHCSTLSLLLSITSLSFSLSLSLFRLPVHLPASIISSCLVPPSFAFTSFLFKRTRREKASKSYFQILHLQSRHASLYHTSVISFCRKIGRIGEDGGACCTTKILVLTRRLVVVIKTSIVRLAPFLLFQ